MSEQIYAWMLRLYPKPFRERYGAEAMDLFRDRYRDEHGVRKRARLWMDLVLDLMVSVPRSHRWTSGPSARAAAQPIVANGAPRFDLLHEEKVPPKAFFAGGVLSLAVVTALVVLISHPSLSRHSGGVLGGAFQAAAVAAKDVDLDAAERRLVVNRASNALREFYLDAPLGGKIADAIGTYQKSGDDDAARSGEAFAQLLTSQMRDVSHDRHLVVMYSHEATPDRPPGPTPESLARYRADMKDQDCTFEKVAVLPHDIGYLKLNSFPDPPVCAEKAKAVMASLNHVRAIVFDLRDNRGGSPEMVALLASYLFDRPTHLNDMYKPRTGLTEQSWTQPVPGNRLASKPAYVLTAGTTFSAPEEFCYALKMLNRATLVGERTAGGAHAGSWHRLDEHFGMGIPDTKAINPVSKTDWEGTGVAPDVPVPEADAFDTAKKLALRKLLGK